LTSPIEGTPWRSRTVIGTVLPLTISLASYEFLGFQTLRECLVEFCASERASLPITEGGIVGKASVRRSDCWKGICAYAASASMHILRLIEPYIFIGVSKLGDPEPENLGSDVRSNSYSSLLNIITEHHSSNSPTDYLDTL
jgi:hypothetical protein